MTRAENIYASIFSILDDLATEILRIYYTLVAKFVDFALTSGFCNTRGLSTFATTPWISCSDVAHHNTTLRKSDSCKTQHELDDTLEERRSVLDIVTLP